MVLLLGAWMLLAFSEAEAQSRAAPPRPADSLRTSAQTQALFVRGMTRAYVDDYAAAVEQYEQALEHAPNAPAILAALADAHAELGDRTSALYYARQAVRHSAKHPWYALHLADLQRALGRTDDAVATYERILDTHPRHLEALEAFAETQAERNRPRTAIDAYERLLAHSPSPRPEIWEALYTLYSRVGDADGVERSLRALVEHSSDETRYRLRLGRWYKNEDRIDEAEQTFREQLEQTPGHPDAAIQLYDLYQRSGQSHRADSLLRRFAGADGGAPDQLVARARILLRQSSSGLTAAVDSVLTETALQFLQRAVEASPHHPEALQLLGTLQFDNGRYAAAGSTLTAALRENPRSPEQWTRAATAYLNAHQPQRALDVAEEGLLLFPGQAPLLRVAARALCRLDRPQAALRQYKEAMSVTDSSDVVGRARLHASMGLVHRRLGQDAAADEQVARARELAPRVPGVADRVAYDLVARNVELDRAQRMAQDVVVLDSSNVRALHTLGWVHLRRGNLDAAQPFLRRAIQTGRAPAAVYEHLGDVHQARGDTDAARRYWQQALDRDPNRTSVQQKLTSVPK